MRSDRKIPGTTRVRDVALLLPGAAPLLAAYGLHCSNCRFGGQESLEEGCRLHGFSAEEIDNLLNDLSTLLHQLPKLPPTLTITNSAARALEAAVREQGERDGVLCAELDDDGRFCLTLAREPPPGAKKFSCSKSSVRIVASHLIFRRIGGAIIDEREGRFTLTMPERENGEFTS